MKQYLSTLSGQAVASKYFSSTMLNEIRDDQDVNHAGLFILHFFAFLSLYRTVLVLMRKMK